MSTTRRMVRVQVSLEILKRLLLVDGPIPAHTVARGVPKDARIIQARLTSSGQILDLTLEHETFNVVPAGHPAPELSPEIGPAEVSPELAAAVQHVRDTARAEEFVAAGTSLVDDLLLVCDVAMRSGAKPRPAERSGAELTRMARAGAHDQGY